MSDVLNVSSYDCACGRTHELKTEVILNKCAVEKIVEVIAKFFLTGNLAVISAKNLESVGDRVEKLLYKSGYTVRKKTVNDVSPEEVAASAESLPECVRYLVGVGGGTVADGVRLFAKRRDIPYTLVATSPASDGYLSSKVHVCGETVRCDNPDAVIFDTEILDAAPRVLTAAGYGRAVAQVVNIFDAEYNRFYKDLSPCPEVMSALFSEVHHFELEKDKPDFTRRLTELLIKISRADEYLDIDNRAVDSFARVLTAEGGRSFGENSMLAAYVVLSLYRCFLASAADDVLLPPDTVKTLKLLEKCKVIGYNKYIKSYSHYSETEYLRQAYVLGEYRKDLYFVDLRNRYRQYGAVLAASLRRRRFLAQGLYVEHAAFEVSVSFG
jgi:Glycerol dehydrogenase and related enzymes